MVWKDVYGKRGDLPGERTVFMPKSRRAVRTGVRAPIVVMKRGNACGAKGCRKVNT